MNKYFKWLHSFETCCLTDRSDIQIAHTGDLRHGKGMAIKAAEWTCLPISARLHWYEEGNRKTFWPNAGFPDGEHIAWAERLHDIYEKQDDPIPLFLDMQEQADWEYLATILRNAA